MALRKAVFYSTTERVRRGDEYYQLQLDKKTEYPAAMPFKVSIFHGFAGDGNRVPQSEAFFASGDEAESAFDREASKILGEGFQHHSPVIHGEHDF